MQAPRDPILRHVKATVRSRLPDGGHVLLAVSGGRDSVALLDALRRLARPLRLRLTVAHVHHGLRGADADADERFVLETAKAWGLPARTMPVKVVREAARRRIGHEDAARQLRYRALERMRRECAADVIATAHHADDQAETVVLRATRGSHVQGLAGILPEWQRPPVVRPLLDVSRSAIDRYVRRRRLTYREDATNADETFRRNLVRRRLMDGIGTTLGLDPHTAFPRFARAARRLQTSATRWFDRLASASIRSESGVHHIDARELERWPDEVRNALVVRLLRRAALAPTDARLDAVRSLLRRPVGRWRPLGGPWRAWREREGVTIARTTDSSHPPVALVTGRWQRVSGGRVRVSGPRRTPKHLPTMPDVATMDVEAVRGRLIVRPWRPADRVVPLGMASERKVSDLLTDRKVPAHRKRSVPVVVAGKRIVWVCGVALDARVRVRPETKQVLQFFFQSNV